jgi:diguanylate cyclase (GGDEF)-like protein
LPFDPTDFLSRITPVEIGAALLLIGAIFYLRRSGILLWRLDAENRQLRRGIHGYKQMEQQHFEISRENRERNEFHGQLPGLISKLHEERTLPGITAQLVEFTGRALGAAEVTLFLRNGSTLVLRESRGVFAPKLTIAIGQGKIGAVAGFRRLMAGDDFQNVDAATRDALLRSPGRVDTEAAAPLLAHGEVLGVLNVGGSIKAAPALRKEILGLIAQIGATALENQLNFERLEREATTDGLTGLSNVRNFKEKFRQELSRSARFARPCAVFLFDIDTFKHYNDKNGHPAGDECLRLTAELLRAGTRITDLPARYGGEEFVVLLPETDRAGALAFAEKIRAAIAAYAYPHRERQPLGCISISGGVAAFPEDGRELEPLIAAADRALYRCKHAGRNRVGAAEPLGAAGDVAAKAR